MMQQFKTKIVEKISIGKKGINQLLTWGVGFVVVGIVLGIGARVLDKVDDTLTGQALAAVANGTEAIAELSSWLPTIAIIAAAAVIIGLLLVGFGRFRS